MNIANPASAVSEARDWTLDSATLAALPAPACHRHVLANGLTVLLQPDPDVSLVQVAIGYRVGSMEERPGQTGLAHFLEHMMFAGTRRLPGSYLERMLALGATDVNAMTSKDMTRYWQTVPANLLEFVLAAEADRMAGFASNLDPAVVERERSVIQEEKKQNAAQPLGQLWEWLAEGLLPYGHPYHHPVIGHAEDIARHDIAALTAWHAAHYGPGNAVLVIAGGFDPDHALAAVERQFGGIPPTMLAPRALAQVPPTPIQSMMRVQDRLSEPGAFLMAWNTPSFVVTPQAHLALELAAGVLGHGQTGVLRTALVEETGLALDVQAWVMPGRGVSAFGILARLKEAPDARIATAIRAAVDRFLESELTAERLEQARLPMLAANWQGSLSFERRAAQLIEGELLHGDPAWAQREAALLASIEPEEVLATARAWLSGDGFRLEILGASEAASTAGAAPEIPALPTADAVAIRAPAWEDRRLANGALLRLNRRPGSTAFSLRAVGDAGRAHEPEGLEGIAHLAGSLTAFGTANESAAQLATRIGGAGLTAHMAAGLLRTRLSLNGPSAAMPAAFALLSDLLLRPGFGSDDYRRTAETLVARAAARAGMAETRMDLAMHRGLLGRAHRLSQARPASPELLERMTDDDVAAFHARIWRPRESVILLSADIEPDAAVALLDAMLVGWTDGAPSALHAPRITLEPVRPGIRIIDLPGSDTAQIRFAWRIDATDAAARTAIRCLEDALSGGFTSRANQRLRAELGWTYGVGGSVVEPEPGDPLLFGLIYASLAPSRSGDAIREIETLVEGMRGAAPIQETEVASFRRKEAQHLARLSETATSAVDAMEEMMDRGYHDPGAWADHIALLKRLDTDGLTTRASDLLPARGDAVWTVMGDAAAIRASIEAAGLDVRIVEVDD